MALPEYLLDWNRNVIINYPNDADFTSHWRKNNVNLGKRYELSFEREGLQTMNLEDALNGHNAGMKSLQGNLQCLSILNCLLSLANTLESLQGFGCLMQAAGIQELRGSVAATMASSLMPMATLAAMALLVGTCEPIGRAVVAPNFPEETKVKQ